MVFMDKDKLISGIWAFPIFLKRAVDTNECDIFVERLAYCFVYQSSGSFYLSSGTPCNRF